MRTLLVSLFFVFGFGVGAQAQLPDRNHSFSLDAILAANGGGVTQKEKTNGGGGTDTEGSHYFSSTTTSLATQERSLTLQVTMRNFKNAPDQVRLEWFFIGGPVKGPKKFIFDSGSKELSFKGGEQQQEMLQSKELKQKTIKATTNFGSLDSSVGYLPNSSAKTTGTKPKGWIVRLAAGDSVLAVKTSSPSYDDVALSLKDPQALAKWVKNH